MIDESLELIEVVSWNSDDIDYGEMIQVYDGTDDISLTTFTDRGCRMSCRSSSPISEPGMGVSVKFLLDETMRPRTS